jgi:hypothetical protein
MKKRTPKRQRASLLVANEDAKRWGALLLDEVRGWPRVKVKPMFGMLGAWRGREMFAAVPRTRALGTSQSIIFKLKGAPASVLRRVNTDPRVSLRTGAKQMWAQFELANERDLHDALRWIEAAWKAAAKRTK